MGTPEFAVPSLQVLIDSDDDVVAVICQPDKPRGRGRKLASPPVKELAERYGIVVLQPNKIRTPEFMDDLKALDPHLICVTAYGKILPPDVLNLPRHGCINVHASLLPAYRGAAPINRAIVRGETVSGVTTMQMDEGMDTGDMLLWREVPIESGDTGETLAGKLSHLGAELLIETIEKLKSGNLSSVKQDETLATYAPLIKKEDGRIDWSKSAEDIRNLVRGMTPWPGAFTDLDGKRLKIYRVTVTGGAGRPGEVIKSDPGVLRVATGGGSLDIEELQIEGGKRLEVKQFLAGRMIRAGEIIGA